MCMAGLNKNRTMQKVRKQGVCHYCGEFGDTVDHIIPRSQGGTHNIENLVCACRDCNTLRSSMPYDKFYNLMKSLGKREAKRIITLERTNEGIFERLSRAKRK